MPSSLIIPTVPTPVDVQLPSRSVDRWPRKRQYCQYYVTGLRPTVAYAKFSVCKVSDLPCKAYQLLMEACVNQSWGPGVSCYDVKCKCHPSTKNSSLVVRYCLLRKSNLESWKKIALSITKKGSSSKRKKNPNPKTETGKDQLWPAKKKPSSTVQYMVQMAEATG